jgi:hypothetical protein
MAIPTPTEVKPWYLRNITEALALDETSGNVYVRTGFTGDIIISGNVSIPGNVDAHISEIGTSGPLTVPYMPIAGNVIIDSGNVIVSGGVNITNTPDITGNVIITSLPEVEIKNDVGNAIPITGSVSVVGTPTVQFPVTQTDAFGRLRVSEPFTLFDTQARYYDHEQFSSALTGTATVVYNANSSTYEMNVGTAANDQVIRETMRVFPYQPGKSLLIYSTFCMNAQKTNLRQRAGYFGAQNGIYFEVTDNTLNMVIRSSSSGSIVEDRVPQSQWNGDKLNGTGASGFTLNTGLDQIWFCDVEWLGVGSVRTGFIIDGQFIVCHIFHHANTASIVGRTNNTTTYMTTATLPVRYEITNTGLTASASSMRQICASVISEGGYTGYGITEVAGTGTNAIRLGTANQLYPVVSIRLASTRLDSIVLPTQVDFLSTSVNYYQFTLILNATLTGATWTGTSQTGSVQIDTGATAISGGTVVQSGFVSARENVELSALSYFQFQIGRTLAGVSDVLTLVLSSTGNNADILAQLGWQELT